MQIEQNEMGKYNSFFNQLEHFKITKEIVLLFINDAEADTFFAGTIHSVIGDAVIVNHLTSGGTYDGYKAIPIANLYKLEFETTYVDKMRRLSSLEHLPFEEIQYNSENGFQVLLDYACFSKKIVSIELCNNKDTITRGFVEEVDENHVIMTLVDEDGKEDGKCMVALPDVTYISCDGEKEQILDKLYKH